MIETSDNRRRRRLVKGKGTGGLGVSCQMSGRRRGSLQWSRGG